MKAFHEVRNYKSDFMVWHNSYYDISFMAHWHREIELIYVRSGTVTVHVTDSVIHAQEGDLIICDSGDIHYSDQRSEGSCLDFVLFDTAIINSHYHYSFFSNPHITKENLKDWHLTESWFRLLDLLDDELSRREHYYQDVVTASICQFWYLLLRRLPANTTKTIMQGRRVSVLADLQGLLSFLEEHFNESITLEDAAEIMNFSPSHFSKIFKQFTGVNFIKYLNIIRISKAVALLVTTDSTITDISFQCGFNNVRSFNRMFKEITNYTPSEYVRMPENKSRNFTYYHSDDDIFSLPEELPTTVVKEAL
ncbi:MAG: AraC family transcriptional regulator [Lachnospiraceae bacterium]|nr:AraC family transcriptional regulator [Lachnospiraceae bacterium]